MNPREASTEVIRSEDSNYARGSEEEIESLQHFWISQRKLEQHTKIFASMCPDEILDHYDDYNTRMYYTTLMLGDVSGFTDLAEKYTQTGRGGPSKLTDTLNSYIGAMVQEILSHNGDVLKFSGDAFIVMWKLNDGMIMRDLAIEAMQTACIIQKHFGTYETEVGVTLKVKLAIASGRTYFTSIGDPNTKSHYIITGKPVWDVKFAEGLCRGGDILVAPSSWQWVNPNEYVHETLPDGVHTLIIACTSTWYQSKDDSPDSSQDEDSTDESDYAAYDSMYISETMVDSEAKAVMMSITGNTFEAENFRQVDYSLRPKVIKIAKARLKDALRSYMLRPVIRSVEMDEPLEYLTEMRQVVILFINVVTRTVGKRTLISFVNSAYKLVCKTVGEMHGCVNKTSLFDKDLMFLCVFGLRGDKHELESQIGLRCASKVRTSLLEMENVKSVTVGVTTGMTYCGVVGHILRREYTVIGISVNKAARLMVTYQNKARSLWDFTYAHVDSIDFAGNVRFVKQLFHEQVVCDRESFLHSRLEARHFILQEPRYLKGITNVGPIYEFQEQPKFSVSDLVWNKYPLLGREAEIKTFRWMLLELLSYSSDCRSDSSSEPEYNTLVIKYPHFFRTYVCREDRGKANLRIARSTEILLRMITSFVVAHWRGEPRIGKTRLLDEFTQNIPDGVYFNYVSLHMDDSKIPYNLIHLIFSMPLGFTVTSTRKEREGKLLRRLGKVRQSHFLCALNQPFNVRFAISHRYNALTNLEKQKVLRKFLLKLMKGCFEELWVIIIDDAEYSDQESMQLFDVLVKKDLAFYVLGIGRKLGADFQMSYVRLKKVKVIELIGIDRWYHAGLACQILNVNGLPAELEKLIQERSFGNPGWIESYLISLLQAGGLEIVNISKRDAVIQGYVLPPVSMLKRFMSQAMNSHHAGRRDRWQMYRSSFKDSTISIHERNSTRDSQLIIESDETMIAVCNISENFTYEDVETEMTMDVMILKLFDSLTPLDQFLLKCASVIGETVNRHMLESLMNLSATREIGLAILKLFEIRVFGCAIGDFSRNAGPIIFIRNMRNPGSEMEIFCGCIGLRVSIACPRHRLASSCGKRLGPTTERLYSLRRAERLAKVRLLRLDEIQDVDVSRHDLSKLNTIRLLTENQKMELHSQALKYLQQNTRRCLSCGEGQFAKLLGKVSKTEDRRKRTTAIDQILGNVDCDDNDDGEESGKESKVPLSCLNLFRRVERKPTITFSDVDFSDCQCQLILMTVYTQMVDHCRGIGKIEQTLTAILEFAEICLMICNIPQARKLLMESETILEELFESNEDEEVYLTYLRAKIQTLQGQCFLESGSIFEAEQTLEMALYNLGYTFPRLELMIDLKSFIQQIRLRFTLAFSTDRKHDDDYEEISMDYTDQLAECLAQMFNLFRIRGMKKHARLAAIWGLNTALASSRSLFVLCTSYTNMLITAHMYQDRTIIPYLEERGINIYSETKDALEPQDLNIIAELYAGIFFSRWVRGQISKAISIGFVCCRMANTTGSTFLKLLILPRLLHLLILSCRNSEVVVHLRELEFVSHNDLDNSGRTWYYALCADVQLDLGLTILSFRRCEQYFLREGETLISLHDPEAERRYFISMWLWCIRTEQWEAAKVWGGRNVNDDPIMDEHIVAATITSLKKLEGLLILYVHKINSRNIDAAATMTTIRSMFKGIKKMIKVVTLIIPRYMLLQAYYYMIRFQKRAAMKLLKRLQKVCVKTENKMIYAWALHCEKTWSGSMSSVQKDMWQEPQDSKLQHNWNEINANKSTMVVYTFPLPRHPV